MPLDNSINLENQEHLSLGKTIQACKLLIFDQSGIKPNT